MNISVDDNDLVPTMFFYSFTKHHIFMLVDLLMCIFPNVHLSDKVCLCI